MAYDHDYYRTVFKDFDDPVFVRRWAKACALTGGYGQIHWKAFLEFGAGPGHNLAAIFAERKWAVDISKTSAEACAAQGFDWRSSLDEVPDRLFDGILLRHSLEHLPDPRSVLKQLHRKGTEDTSLFVVVPVETTEIPDRLTEMDVHQHLYSWTPMTLKNLCISAGWHPLWVRLMCGRGFHATLPLVDLSPEWFLRIRSFADRFAPAKTGEIAICCKLGETGPTAVIDA
jgi:SAM-dependent methyltransferase